MCPDPEIICNMLRNLAKPTADLSSYATEDAVETLLENWKAAMRDGVGLQGLVADVDGVIEHLKDFRNSIVAIYPEAHPPAGVDGPGTRPGTGSLRLIPA
jgi:hypothetical protein